MLSSCRKQWVQCEYLEKSEKISQDRADQAEGALNQPDPQQEAVLSIPQISDLGANRRNRDYWAQAKQIQGVPRWCAWFPKSENSKARFQLHQGYSNRAVFNLSARDFLNPRQSDHTAARGYFALEEIPEIFGCLAESHPIAWHTGPRLAGELAVPLYQQQRIQRTAQGPVQPRPPPRIWVRLAEVHQSAAWARPHQSGANL